MAKVIALSRANQPAKFGFKPVRKKRPAKTEHPGQLNLFDGARVVSIHQLTPFEEALMLDEQHDKRAKELYLKAIDAADSTADAYCNLGILESEGKNYSKAIDYFTQALGVDARHYEAHYNLANVYAEIGNPPLAKLHYQTSIAIEPTFPNSHFNLGLTLAVSKEYALAVEALNTFRAMVEPSERTQADELITSLKRYL